MENMLPKQHQFYGPNDELVWKGSSSGKFSLVGAVHFLQSEGSSSAFRRPDPDWGMVWKWKGLAPAKPCICLVSMVDC